MNTIIEDLFEFVIDRYPEIALEAVDAMRFGMLANDRNRKREEAKTSIEPISDDPKTTAFIADLDEIRSKIKPMRYSPLMPSQAMCLKKGQVVFLSDHSTDDPLREWSFNTTIPNIRLCPSCLRTNRTGRNIGLGPKT